MGVAVNQTGVGFAAASTTGIVVAISSSLIVGMPTFVAAKTDTAAAHVWPAGWTVVFAQACDGGYFSVARRVRAFGDANTVTVTNGGVSSTWRTSYVGWNVSGTASAISQPSISALVTPAANAIPIPALVAPAEGWTIAVFLSVVTTLPLANDYPLLNVQGGVSGQPAILQLPLRADTGSPAITLQRTDVATTGVYATLLTDGGLGYQATGDLEDAQRVDQRGYNGYTPTLESYGGSVSVA